MRKVYVILSVNLHLSVWLAVVRYKNTTIRRSIMRDSFILCALTVAVDGCLTVS